MSEKRTPRLLTATPEEIAAGKVTDVYFLRTREILLARGIRKQVRAEILVKSFPRSWPWAIMSGLEEVLEILEGRPVTVRSIPEGSPFRTYTPVLEIAGDYLDFGILETAVLGCLCQASGITTAAARCVKLAEGRPVISFGARRMHPALAPLVERCAYIGGCSGVAAVKSAEVLGIEPTGTIPHALVILMGDSVQATMAFNEIIDARVPRVALVDTFGDEKFESMAVAEALGKDLYGVRLDTTSSRRGDFARILEEVRWELDLRGHG
ncbi:MAG: nicotinate phosphoribosyltransferase, partial [bacterium]